MKLIRAVPGERVSMPLSSVGEDSGWGMVEPEEHGIVVCPDASERDGLFITDAQLKELGFYFRKPRTGSGTGAKGKQKKSR